MRRVINLLCMNMSSLTFILLRFCLAQNVFLLINDNRREVSLHILHNMIQQCFEKTATFTRSVLSIKPCSMVMERTRISFSWWIVQTHVCHYTPTLLIVGNSKLIILYIDNFDMSNANVKRHVEGDTDCGAGQLTLKYYDLWCRPYCHQQNLDSISSSWYARQEPWRR